MHELTGKMRKRGRVRHTAFFRGLYLLEAFRMHPNLSKGSI